MSTTTLSNGQARKSLAEQIDRLDSILDGLADNLNDAVATAALTGVKDAVAVAVQEAVHAALIEVLTNAELHKRLEDQQQPVPTPSTFGTAAVACLSWVAGVGKSAWSIAISAVQVASSKVKSVVKSLFTAATTKVQQAREQLGPRVRSCWMWLSVLATLAKRFRVQLLAAVGVGVLVGVVCYVGGREIASVGCGVAGFVGSLATAAVNRLKRMLPLLVAAES